MIRKAFSLLFAVLTFSTGCDQLPGRPPLGPPLKSKVVQEQLDKQTDTIEAPALDFDKDWDVWYEYNIEGRKVGYSHVSGTRLDDGSSRSSQSTVRFQVEDQVAIRRGDSSFLQHLTTTSLETLNGQLNSFDSQLLVGPIKTQFTGHVQDQQLEVEAIRGSARTVTRLPWDIVYRGMIAVEQSLRRKPMTSGEKRTLKMLLPIKHKIATIELICSGTAAVAMKDGSYQRLIEIVSHESVDGTKISEQVLWTDETGLIQKTLRGDLVAYRADKATATERSVDRTDVIEATTVDVTGVLERPLAAKFVGFIVKPNTALVRAGGTISISPAPGQYVKKTENGEFQLFVGSGGAVNLPGFDGYEEQPSEKDSGANRFFDYNTAMIIGISNAAVKSRAELSTNELLTRLLPTTDQVLTRTSMDRGLTKASEVARTGRGDATDYAVLMAALLRRSQVPSRIAIGLVYDPGEKPGDTPRMKYHVWTLAFIDDRWIPLDPQLGAVAPPNRITLATTNLAEGNEYKVIARVLETLGRISVEVKRAKY